MTTQHLKPVYKFPQGAALVLMVEFIGQTLPRYVCPWCKTETEHATKPGRDLLICLECAQGSVLTEEVMPDTA